MIHHLISVYSGLYGKISGDNERRYRSGHQWQADRVAPKCQKSRASSWWSWWWSVIVTFFNSTELLADWKTFYVCQVLLFYNTANCVAFFWETAETNCELCWLYWTFSFMKPIQMVPTYVFFVITLQTVWHFWRFSSCWCTAIVNCLRP